MLTRVLTPLATGMPTLDAQADFRRARRAYAAARARRWVAGQRGPSRPATLREAAPVLGGRPRLEVVPLGQIVGTVDPTSLFDASFRPASELVRQRWERVALAQRRGIPLPAIELVHGPDGYYVIDGRHRVSVARALRHADTDAWVYGPGGDGVIGSRGWGRRSGCESSSSGSLRTPGGCRPSHRTSPMRSTPSSLT